VFTGYSSLAWALSIPEDGKVVACDTSTEFTDIGKPFWKEAGVDHKIDLRIAPAAETLREFTILKCYCNVPEKVKFFILFSKSVGPCACFIFISF